MLRGKNAIITGARSGIGFATLQLFAQKRVNCWAIVHRDDTEFEEQIQLLQEQNNIWIKRVYIDLSESESIKTGIKEIIKEKRSIDILVNAAGIVSPDRLFSMTNMLDIRKVMDVNFFSILETIQLVSRVMLRQRSGSIINVASVAADCEDTSQLEYAASKAALVCATKKLAREMGAVGIRVNAVSPGLTDTKMAQEIEDKTMSKINSGLTLRRLGRPEEIAKTIAFLASDDSSFINGENVKVDGGGFDLRLMIKNR
ncbi:SDR family NAD(P)-dependent oxidoreductase [Bacteroides cutis]|jgi:3-oxoacyl-[acyl-carrier protein] reductase|uniref:SDR family NAD(P)-dependent oxidoreductase n=1 Tax=Bacteroides cutis TaxID=2024197 RepID=UPI0023A8881B|nr:SDR family oxidoreductase [Bacteroides cutis]